MLGPDDEAKHAAYAAVAGAFDIPVLGYSSTDSKYSDKVLLLRSLVRHE